jgi:chorismate synthase
MDPFGINFIISDIGETYSKEWIGKIEGCPRGVPVDMDFVHNELQRRSPSQHPFSTKRNEPDAVIFQSGIKNGLTTGEPIIYTIPNCDIHPDETTCNIIKPSHASYVYKVKYGATDNLACGRASARQTVCRVVAGAIAKCFLTRYNIHIEATANLVQEIPQGDTHGALVHCSVSHLPAGLGEPVYNKFHARLAYAMLSINCAKGFSIGKGFEAATMLGSQFNDVQQPDFGFITNHDGGVQAGITTGQELYFDVAFKPIPSLQMEQQTITFDGEPTLLKCNDKNDICVIPRVLPVVEAMTAVVIADFLLMSE